MVVMDYSFFSHPGWVIAFTAFGASILWAKWSRQERLDVIVLSKLLHRCGLKGRLFTVVEFVLFVAFGAIVALGVGEPDNLRQGFAAGLGWTALLSNIERTAGGEVRSGS